MLGFLVDGHILYLLYGKDHQRCTLPLDVLVAIEWFPIVMYINLVRPYRLTTCILDIGDVHK